jgi:hypothetical protein
MMFLIYKDKDTRDDPDDKNTEITMRIKKPSCRSLCN